MHTLTVHKFDPVDPRLGRHVHHDSRSLDFEFLPRDVKAKGQNAFWDSLAKPLNQGNTGSCTGNATAQDLNTLFMAAVLKAFHRSRFLTEADALKIYGFGTHLDSYPGSYPPDDTGCDGISVAKAGVQLGYLDKYTHTFSFQAAQAAAEVTPSIWGTVWTNSMFKPTNGLVKVGKITDANTAGGHEYLDCGIDWNEEVFIKRNSWGDQPQWPGCKPGGYFAIGFGKRHNFDAENLLAAQGDVTILHGKGMA